ncbi:hypothetical protein SAMN06269250_0173 [Spirosoma fluviale]|uniref:Uncharacterized protein n=1 Tax=Spirosoma fluviale TaxID=1597977 RepID=A0A286GXA0_9BACT|nr:hypothetical protein SAMN06269250_0173 [Spirosoma fluviale]
MAEVKKCSTKTKAHLCHLKSHKSTPIASIMQKTISQYQ